MNQHQQQPRYNGGGLLRQRIQGRKRSSHEELLVIHKRSSDEKEKWCWREIRHSSAFMIPVCWCMILMLSILSTLGLILQLPSIVIGWMMRPLMGRMHWLVEFLYPSSIAKWGHFFLLNWNRPSNKNKSKNESNKESDKQFKGMNLHTRAIEQRIVVLPNRIYIHLLPQLLDNVGYLIVFVSSTNQNYQYVGWLIDVGDAKSVLSQISYIQDAFYDASTINLQGILSTHKHHDHTAGNKHFKKTIPYIYGAANEKVPHANQFVKNGTLLPLPHIEDNEDDSVEMECIIVPSHTRGSTVFALHTSNTCHLFTGDTLFLGGSGMPFEADLPSKPGNSKKWSPLAFHNSMERCLAQILLASNGKKTLVYPGHEYTCDLLQRTLNDSSGNKEDSLMPEWNKMEPSVFLEFTQAYLVSQHKRTLPKHSRLSTIPNTLAQEQSVNPQLIKLKHRARHIVTAIQTWYKYLATGNIPKNPSSPKQHSSKAIPTHTANTAVNRKQPASYKNTESNWNLDYDDLNQSVFTTVYTHDLEQVIQELQQDQLSKEQVAQKLRDLKKGPQQKTVHRRPVPGTLPSEKNMSLGIQALALLGSPPCAITFDDATTLELPAPHTNMDTLLISKQRLIQILLQLNVLDDTNTDDVIAMIHLLWSEARVGGDLSLSKNYDSVRDVENNNDNTAGKDWIELGLLKLTLYAVPLNQSRNCFSKFCLPTSSPSSAAMEKSKKHKRVNAELVRHDPTACLMCGQHVLGRFCCDSDEASSYMKQESPPPFNEPERKMKISSIVKQDSIEMAFNDEN